MFKEGDKVKCIDARAGSCLSNGNIYTITENQNTSFVTVDGINERFFAIRFELCDELYPTLRNDYV